MKRREVCKLAAGLGAASVFVRREDATAADTPEPFNLRYILSSALYGEMPLEDILPEVEKTGCEAIDIWCRVHGNQREQIEAMGHAEALTLFETHGVKPAVFTRYPLGPFGLREEMSVAKRLGAQVLVCGTTQPSEPSGPEAKIAVKAFLEKMKPHAEAAGEAGLVIALENHDRQLLYHPDSLRYFAEFNASKHLGIALAPHHLHRFVPDIPGLIRDLGNEHLAFVYFQEHSEGIRKEMPKEIEMQQLPGHGGGLDYRPIVRALRDIRYQGYAEIFMHPVPRGIPILPTIAEIRAALNRARAHVERCLEEVRAS